MSKLNGLVILKTRRKETQDVSVIREGGTIILDPDTDGIEGIIITEIEMITGIVIIIGKVIIEIETVIIMIGIEIERETETDDQGGTLAIMGEGDMVVEIVILIDPPLIETKILTEIVIVDIDHMAQETEKERHPHVIITEVIMKETMTEGEREEEKEKEKEWVAGTEMPIDLDVEDIAIPIKG